ncbi:MAG: hypothetical protein JWR32_3010 [Mycobacterium sp.]|jgi:transcriptional regulator with XRE-family HTH domain|nr:hypothetical protein [Mycobacterium sp.]
MGNTEVAETEFRKTLRRERESRKWSQAYLAKLLSDRGITAYATTIAKVEAGERAARIDELVTIADIFGVSVDALLGHSVERSDDKPLVLNALIDTAQHAQWRVRSIEAELRAAIAALDGFGLRAYEKDLRSGCEQACDALANAAEAIRKVEGPMHKIENQQLRDLIGKGGNRK